MITLGSEKRWDSAECFVATCKAFDAIQKAKEELGREIVFLCTLEDINTLQDTLIAQGYAIQKIKTDVIPENPPVIQTGTKYFLDTEGNKIFKQEEGEEIELLNSKPTDNG